MLSPIVAQDYRRFKESTLGVQTIRLSCATFWVFAYWNLVRSWILNGGTSGAWLIVTAIMTALSGLVLGVLLTIRYSNRVLLHLLPWGVVACFLTVPQAEAARVVYIPFAACALLIIVRTIIWSSNTINRF